MRYAHRIRLCCIQSTKCGDKSWQMWAQPSLRSLEIRWKLKGVSPECRCLYGHYCNHPIEHLDHVRSHKSWKAYYLDADAWALSPHFLSNYLQLLPGRNLALSIPSLEDTVWTTLDVRYKTTLHQ